MKLGRVFVSSLAAFALLCNTTFAADDVPRGFDSLDADGQAEALVENPTLESALAKAEEALEFAAQCKGMECPKVDCELAGQLYSDLKKLEYLLQAEIHYAQKASDAELAHHRALVEQSIISGDNLSRAQWALGVQQYLHNLSKSIADVASLADTLRSFANKGLGDNWGDTLEQLDAFEQRLRTVDGLSTRLAKGLGAEGAKDVYKPHVTPFEGFDNTRSATVDVLKAIRKYKKEMKDAGFWDASKKIFNPGEYTKGAGSNFTNVKEGLRKNLLSWTQKILAAYDKKLMKEREARIDDLVNNLSAEDRAIGAAFLSYQKALRKLELAEEAQKQVKAAIQAVLECMAKAKCDGSLGWQRPELPDFDEKHWGDALRTIESRIKDVVHGMTIPTVEDDCGPTGATDETGLHMGEGFKVLVVTDSTKWCHFRPGTPVPLPFYPGGPITLAPPPMIPGGPMVPFSPGMPIAPGYPMGPATTPGIPVAPGIPNGPYAPGFPGYPTPQGPVFYPGMPR